MMTIQTSVADRLTHTRQSTRSGHAKSNRRVRKKASTNNLLVLGSQIVVVLAFLVIWELFSQTDVANRADMPGPIVTFTAFLELITTSDFWAAISTTLGSWALALLLALVVGISVGLFIGRSKFAYESTNGTIDFLRTIPAVALVPLFLLVLGQSQTMVVVVAMIPAVWPLMIQSISAGHHADPLLHRVSRSYRLTLKDRLLYVLAPEALAFIWPGIRLATTTSLLAVVFTELLGGREGIGVELMDAQIYNQTDQLYAWVLTACFLGLFINGALAVTQKYVLGWHPAFRGKDA